MARDETGHPLFPGARKWVVPSATVAAWLCRRHSEVTLRELAPLLGLSRADSVPNLTSRMDARLRTRPKLADEFQQTMARIEPETKNQV